MAITFSYTSTNPDKLFEQWAEDTQTSTTLGKYYIIPDKLQYGNLDLARCQTTGWTLYTERHIKTEDGSDLMNQYAYGFWVRGNTASEYRRDCTSAEIPQTPLKLVFNNAVQDTYLGTFSDLSIEISNVQVCRQGTHDIELLLIDLTDLNKPSPYDAGFWIQAFISTVGGVTGEDRMIGISADIKFTVDNAQPNTTFAYPFEDIDFTADISTSGSSSRVEAVELVSGCSETVYVRGDNVNWLAASGNRIYNGDGSPDADGWHTSMVCMMNATGATIRWTGSACGTSLQGDKLTVYRIGYNMNGSSTIPIKPSTIPSTQYKVKYKKLLLTGVVPERPLELRCFSNGGGNFVLDSGSSYYYKTSGVYTVVGRDASFSFNGWATTPTAISGEYQPLEEYTNNQALTLYAVWVPDQIVTLIGSSTSDLQYVDVTSGYRFESNTATWTYVQNSNTAGDYVHITDVLNDTHAVNDSSGVYVPIWAKWEYQVLIHPNGGYRNNGSGWSPSDIQIWKKYGATINLYKLQDPQQHAGYEYNWVRSGYNLKGFDTSSSGSGSTYPYNPQNDPYLTYTSNTPITLYAIWEVITYVVRFLDGFSQSGHDLIKSVTVNYGGSVAQNDVPVEGQTYGPPYNKQFKKPGPYHLAGWAGSYQNVTSDRDVVAMWEFTPIWIKVGTQASGSWIKYKPVEQ